jgi:hypothetical protein
MQHRGLDLYSSTPTPPRTALTQTSTHSCHLLEACRLFSSFHASAHQPHVTFAQLSGCWRHCYPQNMAHPQTASDAGGNCIGGGSITNLQQGGGGRRRAYSRQGGRGSSNKQPITFGGLGVQRSIERFAGLCHNCGIMSSLRPACSQSVSVRYKETPRGPANPMQAPGPNPCPALVTQGATKLQV